MPLRLLLAGDLHYTGSAARDCKIPARKTEYGLEFIKRVFGASRPGSFDAVIFMGDVVDNGLAEGAEADFREIREEAASFGAPCFFVRGNHDCPEDVFRQLSGMKAEYAVIGDYLLYFFNDRYSEGDYCRRSEADMGKFKQAAGDNPGKKLLVFQHSPLFPKIQGAYPYNLENAEKTHASYRENGVCVSVSGHYHRGIGLFSKDGTGYLTVPALCEFPFAYTEMDVEGLDIMVSLKTLAPEGLLWDNHCHTEFAYCGENVSVGAVCARAGLLGLDYVGFAEHAGQLYLPRENYWAGDCYGKPRLIHDFRESGESRFERYKSAVSGFRGARARLGLEAEPDKEGNLSLLPGHREDVDFLLGAVHFLPQAGKKETRRMFMEANEALLRNGVDAVAHPFRYFRRAKTPAPKELFPELAGMLKSYGAAAEVNFHLNEPPLEFFERCLEEGVKISVGTDTHNLLEAGDLSKHIGFLRKLGVSPEKDREKFLVF